MKFFKGIFLVMLLGLGLGMTSMSVQGQFGGWRFERIGQGTKPAVSVNSQGQPLVVYLLERTDGWVRAAQWNGLDWDISTVSEGHFDGPPSLVMDGNDVPHISYHDYQDITFRVDRGDAVHAMLNGEGWVATALEHDGHDGWDASIAVDGNNNIHISGIDPQDFNGSGLEYYFVNPNGGFIVETLDSDPLTTQFGTSIAVTRSGVPYIAFYDQDQRNLKLARRTGTNRWGFETVDRVGNNGMFPSMTIDADGGVHISYVAQTGLSFATIKYAYQNNPGARWQITEVDSLRDLFIGLAGARNVTSLALDSHGHPWITYGDQQVVKLARFDGDLWNTETVAIADGDILGQITSLALDANDRPHIAYSVVTNREVLDGFIMHATR